MPDIALFSVVALTQDLPDRGLSRGQMGTILEKLAPDVYEVEFSGENGETYATATIEGSKLMRLHREPVPSAA
ncbi:MAG: DUF4926 domain-containing protein [Bryobacterales bacterium]|nr:DUF4926 domain-containing protein [Acidobacteriota bacterium]MCB9384525.1 DUF4926 domain-containing protein [Bryobacterales bacterium]